MLFLCFFLKVKCLYCPQGSVSSGSLLMSDQPIAEEDGFLPATSVSMSRAGEAAIVRLAGLNGPDASQGRAAFPFDEEEQQSEREQSVTTEPGLEDLGLEDLVEENHETFSNEAEDGGSGGQEDNEQEQKGMEQRAPAETDIRTGFQPRVSEEKEKTRNESELRLRDHSQSEDVGDDGKKTWYFWK